MGIFGAFYGWFYGWYTGRKPSSSEGGSFDVKKFELRVLMTVTILLTMFDVVTDIWVLYIWWTESLYFHYALAISAFTISVLIDTIGYMSYTEPHQAKVTVGGVFLHLLGLGCAWHSYYRWNYPKSFLQTFNEEELWGVNPLGFSVLVECLVRAVPLMSIQCYVIIQLQNYNVILLTSACSSFLCASIPALTLVAFVKKKSLNNSVREYIWKTIEYSVDVFVWTTDSLIRMIPLIYLLVHRFEEGVVLIAVIMVTSTIYIIYAMGVSSLNMESEHGLVMGWTLAFSSIYKVYSFLYQKPSMRIYKRGHSLSELAVRVSISAGVVIWLYLVNILHLWQLGLFLGLAIFTFVLQLKFFWGVAKDSRLTSIASIVRATGSNGVASATEKEYDCRVSSQADTAEVEMAAVEKRKDEARRKDIVTVR